MLCQTRKGHGHPVDVYAFGAVGFWACIERIPPCGFKRDEMAKWIEFYGRFFGSRQQRDLLEKCITWEPRGRIRKQDLADHEHLSRDVFHVPVAALESMSDRVSVVIKGDLKGRLVLKTDLPWETTAFIHDHTKLFSTAVNGIKSVMDVVGIAPLDGKVAAILERPPDNFVPLGDLVNTRGPLGQEGASRIMEQMADVVNAVQDGVSSIHWPPEVDTTFADGDTLEVRTAVLLTDGELSKLRDPDCSCTFRGVRKILSLCISGSEESFQGDIRSNASTERA